MIHRLFVVSGWLAALATPLAAGHGPRPDILLVTVDTLRTDHLSGYGYERPTSPEIDRLLAHGVRFEEARTPEPLTAPALTSILTSLHPHEHGATRNGLPMRGDLISLPRLLSRMGYRTAAFVGSWVLKDPLSGLGEHFGLYREVLTRKRWLGLIRGESTARDLNERAIAWLDAAGEGRTQPVFLWVHYVEPHAPYRLHDEHRQRLGLRTGSVGKTDRYDTEIAFVDEAIGELLRAAEARGGPAGVLTVFAADHGESLGENGYWGHGRDLMEPSLRVPLGFTWPGRIEPGSIDTPATLLDVAPTVLGLLGFPVPVEYRGEDWSGVFAGRSEAGTRMTYHQAHKGAVQTSDRQARKRRRGLLAVARVAEGRKEVFQQQDGERMVYDLSSDAGEHRSLVAPDSQPSEALLGWLERVRQGLVSVDALPDALLTEEDLDRLRALGYLE